MLLQEFTNLTCTIWKSHLEQVEKLIELGIIQAKKDEEVYIKPSMLLITETDHYYVAEFMGSTSKFNNLTIKKHKEKSVYRYLNQFNDNCSNAMLVINPEIGIFKNGLFTTNMPGQSMEELKKRYPILNIYNSSYMYLGDADTPFYFEEGFVSCAVLNLVILNRYAGMTRCKHVLAMFIVKKDIKVNTLYELFDRVIRDGGISLRAPDKEIAKSFLVGQLQNVYLTQNLRETTIGEFINLHPAIIKGAFNSEDFLYEAHLRWMNQNDGIKHSAINPDLFVKRSDGFYDIYDLKTALLNKNSVVKGKRNRRRFNDSVLEGIAQLANYAEYFEHEKNAEYAEQKYGIKVCNPNLILIVGNFDNVDIVKVAEACRMFGKRNINVIDYDTLCKMYINA